jgi:hypothetical protein
MPSVGPMRFLLHFYLAAHSLGIRRNYHSMGIPQPLPGYQTIENGVQRPRP